MNCKFEYNANHHCFADKLYKFLCEDYYHVM